MGRKKAYDRDEVLKRAMTLFWKVGYEGAHLSELVKITGLNRFGLYKEFGGKTGLFEEALQFYLTGARQSYENLLTQKPLGLHNIKSYFHALQYEPDYHGCFMINTLIEKHVVSEKSFEMVTAFTMQAKQLFKDNLKAEAVVKQSPDTGNLDVVASLLLVLDQGLSLFGITNPNNDTKNKIVELALSTFLEKYTSWK